jgi:hypothetical protein
MMLFALNLVLFCVLQSVDAVRVGIIQNASLLINCSHLTMNASTCNECSCIMLNLTQNTSILSLNCHVTSGIGVSCDLFTAATYLSSCFYQMENNTNSTFYFQQLPSINQSATEAATTVQTLAGRKLTLFTCRRRWQAIVSDFLACCKTNNVVLGVKKGMISDRVNVRIS